MEDYEVGVLWRAITPLAGDDSVSYWQSICAELIHKLVEERRNSIEERSCTGDPPSLIIALYDFDISRKDYND